MSNEEDTVTVPRRVLQIVLATAAGSMDAGSGFLDDEEVDALRAAAVALGVDPIEVTPRNHRCRYRGHKFSKAQDWKTCATYEYCYDCNTRR